MEGVFPRNVLLNIIFRNSSGQRTIRKIIVLFFDGSYNKGENEFGKRYSRTNGKHCTTNTYSNGEVNSNTSAEENYGTKWKNWNSDYYCDAFCRVLLNESWLVVLGKALSNISSMLKRSRSMEFDSDQLKSSSGSHQVLDAGRVHCLAPSSSSSSSQANSKDDNNDDDSDSAQIAKKLCNSSSFDESKSTAELDGSSESNWSSYLGRPESYRRFSQSGENATVTQSRSIFSHKNCFVYGNPKEDIKCIDKQHGGDGIKRELPSSSSSSFEGNQSSNALDLSCKAYKVDASRSDSEGSTYQKYQRGSRFGGDSTPNRPNAELKMASLVNAKKPSLPEQLQIAKIQQQQRRSMQQQQKFLQQMRKSLDSKLPSNRQDSSQMSPKNPKHFGSITTNHEPNELDNHQRTKDEFYPRFPGLPFPHFPYPYFDPNHPKELPDNHPILPLLDPVYFSALYNAHGFLPPSSPSIAAAFIGTLQDAFPKLPMMFPSTSSNPSPLLPQKSNENLK